VIIVRHKFESVRKRSREAGSLAGGRKLAIGTALAHVKYLQHRPGQDRESGGRFAFDATEDRVDPAAIRTAIRQLKTNNVVIHKLTLSPEINPADVKEFTREIMENLSADKGQELIWWAVEHRNTDHHHPHVIILGKDKQGKSVWLDSKDHDLIHAYGDRYLERVHPLELKQAQEKREKELELKRALKEAERLNRIKEGLELPWLHQKIIREQLEPYKDWKKAQLEDEARRELAKRAREEKGPAKPRFQDTIEALGQEWSAQSSLAELRGLNEQLWRNADERIPPAEYKKLIRWIRDKEDAQERSKGKSQKRTEDARLKSDKERAKDSFVYKGKAYSKDMKLEQLTKLSRQLADKKNKERLPIDDYQKLRKWIEEKDRHRFSGILEKQLGAAKRVHDLKEKARNHPDAHRYVSPLQKQMMKNPVMGLFMSVASLSQELVRSIPLKNTSDPTKKSLDELEAAKKDRMADRGKRRDPKRKAKDDEVIDKIDDGIENIRKSQDERKTQKKRGKDSKDRDLEMF